MKVWKYGKFPQRSSKIPKNSANDKSIGPTFGFMNGTQIRLGRGIAKKLSSPTLKKNDMPKENIWDIIQEFGIPREDLKKLNPKYSELFEIYSAIKDYRSSVLYLKKLKNKIK